MSLAREMKHEADTEETKATEGESWLKELSFSTLLTVVGIGVTVVETLCEQIRKSKLCRACF